MLHLQAEPVTPSPFVDVAAGYWADAYIRSLWASGLTQGEVVNGQRYFYPDRSISRAEAATMLGRVLELSKIAPEGRPFIDWDQVPDWAKPSVQALAIMGRINGFPDGGYHPSGQLQRDEAAKILAQFFVP